MFQIAYCRKRLWIILRNILLLVVSFSSAMAQEAKPEPGVAADQNTKHDCVLSGMVVSAVGGAPVRKATVRLFSMEQNRQSDSGTEITDAQGHFSFTSLPAGQFRLFVSHPGYVPAPQSESMRSTYTLSAGQEIKDVVFRLTPAAVLRGRVTDEDGDPVSGIEVQVVSTSRRRHANVGNRGVVGGASSDDLGEFRVFSVPPGKYYVEAIPQMEIRSQSGQGEKQEIARVSTFYPAALRREDATALDVHGGDEIVVNITLQRAAAYPVTGTLRNARGGPVSQGMILAMQGHTREANSNVSAGKFELRLPPGKYSLMGIGIDDVISGGFGFGSQGPPHGLKRIEVPEGGLRDVEVVLEPARGPGVHVTGRVRVEGGGSLPEGRSLLVSLQQSDSHAAESDEDEEFVSPNQPGGLSPVKPDGNFEMKEVPAGTYELFVNAMAGGLEDWYTKAVFVGNRDVLNTGVSVFDTDLQLDIIVSSKGASLEGVVKDSEQHPSSNAIVVAVPDPARAKRHSLYETAATDQNGHFLLRGLEPGSYTAYAFARENSGTWFDPESMKQYKDDGVSVTVHVGEKARADLRQIVSREDDEVQ